MASIENFDKLKVNYNKIEVNFNEIIKKLHLIAKDYAQNEVPSIKLENLAFDTKSQDFIGGGENKQIMMVRADGQKVEDDNKADFLTQVKTYVHYFVGEEEEKYVTEDNLYPITDVSAVPDVLSTDYRDTEVCAVAKESLDYCKYGKVVDMLFEATTSPSTASSDTFTIGYSVPYNIDVSGKEGSSLADSIKGKMRGLFGGVIADLKNIKIKVGGQDFQIGKILDWDKWKEVVGVMDIDIQTVPQNIKHAFDTDFPNNNINTSSIKVWGRQPLVTQLNRSNKLSPDTKKRIMDTEYSIVIDVDENDPNYPKYDKDSIANTVSKALGTSDNLTNWNKVSKKDIIKIDDISGIYKKKSEYDKNERGKSQTVKESLVIEDVDKTTPKGFILTDDYKNYIESQIANQKDIELSSIPSSDCDIRFLDSKECLGILEAKKVNDSDLLSRIKDTKQKCLYSCIKEEPGKNDIIRNKIRKIYKNIFINTKNNFKVLNKIELKFQQPINTIVSESMKCKTSHEKLINLLFEASSSPKVEIIDVFPDPIESSIEQQGTQKKSSRSDWYIIPHKMLKKLDRKHQETQNDDGTTTAKTSKEEYKP